MYITQNTSFSHEPEMISFIQNHGFGILLTDDLQVSHLPFSYFKNEQGERFLLGHMAKANPHWKAFNKQRVSVIFNGPHSYISPQWYQNSPAVPTWNYVAVQIFGKIELVDGKRTRVIVEQLTKQYEPEILENIELMPNNYRDRLLQAVVGFQITIDEIQGKEKLGQHKKAEEQRGVYQGLINSPNTESQALAKYMKNRKIGIGC